MRDARSVAIVIPALDEAPTIAQVVRGFRELPFVDRVLVVDNGSVDGTGELARAAGAEVVLEPRPGYGRALRTGIERALERRADLLALAEGDGTFDPGDLERLLRHLDGRDLVLGSRTRSMRGALGLGNRAVARLLAGLWPRSSCRLTDVGCTYRAFTAQAWSVLRAGATADGPEFSAEMIAEAFSRRLATLEIAVEYGPRKGGASKHTGSALAASRTALRMLRVILARRIGRRIGGGAARAEDP
jgi:glycosyltransferase involved in cell wall biosynthesis